MMPHTPRGFASLVLPALALLSLAACSSSNPETAKGPPQFAELMPAAMAPPPPPPPPPEPVMASPPPPSGPMYGGHLASYSREADAIRGWNNTVRQHSSIGTLKRHLVSADTPKGRMLRLIAGDFPSIDEANRFCTWAKQQNLYCAVMQLSSDGMSASPLPPPARPARAARPAPAPMASPAAPMPAPAAPPAAAPSAPPATAPAAPRG